MFFDPDLSSCGEVACATCHLPGKGFTDSDYHNVAVPKARHQKAEMFPENSRICGGIAPPGSPE